MKQQNKYKLEKPTKQSKKVEPFVWCSFFVRFLWLITKFPFCILRSWFHIFCDILEKHLEKKYQKYYCTENKNDKIVVNHKNDKIKPNPCCNGTIPHIYENQCYNTSVEVHLRSGGTL